MDFRILGPLEVDDGGRSVELGGARQRALLAILVLRRNEVVSADRLIEDLYGGRPPATAAKSLHAHVSRLRSALRPESRLHTRAGGYVLEIGTDELDADRAAHLLADGRRARTAGDYDTAAVSLAAALRLWRGPPLTDVAYEGFAQDEIARLAELRLECLEERLEADLDRGLHAEVAGELERLVSEFPLRERLRRQLMLSLYRCGRQAEALAAYQNGRRLMLEALGLEPGRELQELERGILNHDSHLDAPGLKRAETLTGDVHKGRRASGVFVGRERELGQVIAAFDDGRSGRGRLVLLTGEAGIGKSRLADELAGHAQAAGANVLWGRCWEAGGAPAYWPWVQALRSYVRERDPDTLRRQLGARHTRPGASPAGSTGALPRCPRAARPRVGGRTLPPLRRRGDVPSECVRGDTARARPRRPPCRGRAVSPHAPVRRGGNRRGAGDTARDLSGSRSGSRRA